MIGGWREAEEVLRKFVRRKAEKVSIGRSSTGNMLIGEWVFLDCNLHSTARPRTGSCSTHAILVDRADPGKCSVPLWIG